MWVRIWWYLTFIVRSQNQVQARQDSRIIETLDNTSFREHKHKHRKKHTNGPWELKVLTWNVSSWSSTWRSWLWSNRWTLEQVQEKNASVLCSSNWSNKFTRLGSKETSETCIRWMSWCPWTHFVTHCSNAMLSRSWLPRLAQSVRMQQNMKVLIPRACIILSSQEPRIHATSIEPIYAKRRNVKQFEDIGSTFPTATFIISSTWLSVGGIPARKFLWMLTNHS